MVMNACSAGSAALEAPIAGFLFHFLTILHSDEVRSRAEDDVELPLIFPKMIRHYQILTQKNYIYIYECKR
jgi:hypothetical protein